MAAVARRPGTVGRRASAPPALDLAAVAAGVIAMFAITVAISAVLALTIYFTQVTEGHVSGLLYYAGLATVVVGGAVAGRRASSRGWLHGGAAGAAYVVISLLVGALLFPGSTLLAGLGSKLLLAFVAGALGGVIGVNL